MEVKPPFSQMLGTLGTMNAEQLAGDETQGQNSQTQPVQRSVYQARRVDRIREKLERIGHERGPVEDDFPVLGDEIDDLSGLADFGLDRSNSEQ